MLDRYKNPFKYRGIFNVAGKPIRQILADDPPTSRILLFVSAASQRLSQGLFSRLVKEFGPKAGSSNKIALVYVSNGKAPKALQNMRQFAAKASSASVWFVIQNRPNSVDVLKEHFIDQLPFVMVLDSKNQIVAANPPFAAIGEFLEKE